MKANKNPYKKADRKAYKIKGNFLMGRNWQFFTKEVMGESKEKAKGKLFSELGSKHRVKRRMIKIDSIEGISMDEVEDPVIVHLLKES